jgi:hypothetical protein
MPDKEDAEGILSRLSEFRHAVYWIFFGINLLFFGMLAAGVVMDEVPEWLWWGRWAAGLLFVGSLTAAAILFWGDQSRPGVVVSPRTEARTGPGEDYQVGFLAPEGRKVYIFEEGPVYRQIGLPAKGLKGWVKKEAVEPVEF